MTGLFAACAVVFLGLTVSMALGWSELRGRAGLDRFAVGYGVVIASAGPARRARTGPRLPHHRRGQRPPGRGRRAHPRGHASVLRVPGAHAIGRLAVALSVVGFPWLTYVQPSFVHRTILANGLVAALLGVAAWTAARHRSRGERLLDVITSAALACCAAAFGVRAALKAAGVGGIDLHDGDMSAVIATLAGTLAAVIWTMTVLTSANRRLTLEVSREKDRQMLLNRVLAISAGSRDADEITAGAADAIAQANGWSSVTVALPGDEEDQGVVGRAFATGLTQVDADVHRSELAVPLRRNGRTLGVLNLESADAGALGAEEVRLAESLAEAISLGLENARLERARAEVTHLMVHDLRTPMVSITGALDLLRQSPGLAPKDQALVEMASRNAAGRTCSSTRSWTSGSWKKGSPRSAGRASRWRRSCPMRCGWPGPGRRLGGWSSWVTSRVIFPWRGWTPGSSSGCSRTWSATRSSSAPKAARSG